VEAQNEDKGDVLERLYQERKEHQNEITFHFWEAHYLNGAIKVIVAHKAKASSTTPLVASSSSLEG
jgi:hypothetical protein